MKTAINEKIEFPNGFELDVVAGNEIIIKKNGKETRKKFNLKNISVKKEGNSLVFDCKNATKREKKMIMTVKAHLNNIIKGLNEPFVYKLEMVYVHFPVTLEINKSKNELIIKNFLGEKTPRTAKIMPGAEIEIEKNKITVTSYDKEIAGQTAANLEKATKIRNRDRRKFQDGIFITEKCGRTM